MIGVLVVTWNRRDDLADCLRSVLCSDYSPISIYVVDNASADGTSESVEREFPEVTLIRADRNLGFAAGNNLGLTRMLDDGVDAAFLLNDDAVVAEDAISALMAGGLDDESVGVLAPKILLHSEPCTIWSAGGWVDSRTGISVQRFCGEADLGQADHPADVQYAVGCAMLVKAEVIRRVGLLNPDYYLYYEETDWCRRIREAGYRIAYVPQSRVWHKVSLGGNGPVPSAYYFARNRLLYMDHAGMSRARIAWAAAGVIRSAAGHLVHGRFDRGRLMLRAVADYYAKRLGTLSER